MEKTSQYNLVKMQKKLQKELDADRYQHTLGVMYTAASLAMCYGEDLEKAQVAGLLHDCAKCIPNERKLKLCEKYDLEISPTEVKAPYLLHAKLGAELARRNYDVEDEEVLSAIRYHTTGRPEMTRLEEIIFLADYIEPMRWKADNLVQIRRTAFHDLDYAVYMTLRDTLSFLEIRGALQDRTTREAFLYYENLIDTRWKTSDADED